VSFVESLVKFTNEVSIFVTYVTRTQNKSCYFSPKVYLFF